MQKIFMIYQMHAKFNSGTRKKFRKKIPRTYMKSARVGIDSSEQGMQSDALDPTVSLNVPTGHS